MPKISDLLDSQLLDKLNHISPDKSSVIPMVKAGEKSEIFLSETTKSLQLPLTRPIIVFDLESTGINPYSDRIIEIGALKQFPDGRLETFHLLINPECIMTENNIAIHGITNEDVADAPTFKEKAEEIFNFFNDCDLGGFGLLKFDVPILREEFLHAGIMWMLKDVKIIDALRIYHNREPRNLSSALKFYCQETLDNAHTAFADAEATFKVIAGQLNHYQDLPKDLEELSNLCNPKNPDKIDQDGKLRWEENEVVLNFGPKSGISLRQLAANEPNFLRWILNKNFSEEVKSIVSDALKGIFLTR